MSSGHRRMLQEAAHNLPLSDLNCQNPAEDAEWTTGSDNRGRENQGWSLQAEG